MRLSGETLDWKVHPFRERRNLGIGILIGIVLFSALAGLWGRAWFWSVFCFIVLFLSLESFFFPTRFILEEEKLVVVRRFSRSERPWKIFRRCRVDGQGVTLSPFTKATWLEAYRAIQVRFSPLNREKVLQLLRERLGSEVEWI